MKRTYDEHGNELHQCEHCNEHTVNESLCDPCAREQNEYVASLPADEPRSLYTMHGEGEY